MTPEIRDFMFGDGILPDKRLEAYRSWLVGVQHRMDVDPPRPQPGQPIRLRVAVAGPQPFDLLRVFYTVDGTAPRPPACASIDLAPTGVGWDQIGWQYVRYWEGELPGQANDIMIRYVVAARQTGSSRWTFADSQADDIAGATHFALWVSDLPAPAWAQTALIYHVFVDRFHPGAGKAWQQPETLSGFFGGTINGVTEQLDYIQGLGYNAIWLSPFFASPSHHGYDATDMYRVEPRLGTNEDLDRLIEAAHGRGIRMILDFVANHWSNLHPTMQAAQSDRQSEFYDWYVWKQWPDQYDGFFGVPEMPKLNLALGSPARQYLLDCARFWLEKGFDGFRLDFAYGPPLDFWVDFRRTCKQTRPDCWLFGEVITAAPLQRVFAPAFDGQIDFLLAEALRQTFGYGRWSLAEFAAFLDSHEAYFAGVIDRLTILDNHDMNRFLFLAGDDKARLKLGALALYTLAGSPINYYGTEAGVTQERPTHYDNRGVFEEARLPMRWGAALDADLTAYFRQLTGLRHRFPVLQHGSRRTVYLDDGVWAYVRQDAETTIAILCNTSPEPRAITFALPGARFQTELLHNLPFTQHAGHLQITLPPQTGAVIK